MAEGGAGPEAKSGRKGCCLIGCLGVGFVGVAILVGGGAWMGSITSRLGDADELRQQRQELEAAEPFTPAADGRIPSERLDAFLRVRARVLIPCNQLQGFFGAVRELEERDRKGDKPGLLDGLAMASAGMKLPGMMADYLETRNRALLEERMSLDEWRWCCVLAYRSGGGTFLGPGAEPDRPDVRGDRGEQELVRRMLLAQLEAARAAGPDSVGADWLAALEAESARLSEPGTRGWPWPDGLPARVRESLEPRREDLVKLHCHDAEQFELGEVRKDGMSVTVD